MAGAGRGNSVVKETVKEKLVLVIDDEENMRHMLQASLKREGFSVMSAANGLEGLQCLQETSVQLVLCDMKMPNMDGLEFLKKAKSYNADLTVIMMSAFATVDTAVKAMRAGAYDVITKPFRIEEVLCVMQKALERAQLREENTTLKTQIEELKRRTGFSGFVGKCDSVKKLLNMAKRVARLETTVLITGESGTGKEVIARGIREESLRSDSPFVCINCGAIPSQLIESEFFGVVKGAFTGADSDRAGLFKEADGGTIFLDEIGELPLELQVKLLRVIQEREVRAVGATSTEKIDVRIVVATSTDLDDAVRKGKFRQDLLFRLNVVELKLPPLRDRIGDVVLLAHHFLEQLRVRFDRASISFSKSALDRMSSYSWPGNVRELENCVEFSIICCDEDKIQISHLPERISQNDSVQNTSMPTSGYSLKKGRSALEQQYIIRALDKTKGNKSRAAELLELSYPSLLEKIKRYGIQ